MALVICSAVLLASFRHTLIQMIGTWYGSRTYSHCFLIVPLFGYLVWLRRKNLLSLQPKGNWRGLPLLAGLALAWLLGNLGEVKVVQEFSMVAMLIVLVWTFFGTAVVRVLAFPLSFLFFAVPFGISLIHPLQDFTAWFTVQALTLSHVPAVLETHTLSIPSGVWTVAEACSGIRFLLSAVVLGTMFASLAYRSRKRQLIFMLASVVVPVIANGFRAYGIVLIAYLTNNKLAAGVDHIVYGGLFSVFIQLLLIVVGLRWREKWEAKNAVVARDIKPPTDWSGSVGAAWIAAAATVLIAATPMVAGHLWDRAAATTGWAEPPVMVAAPWQATPAYDWSWAPDLRGADKAFTGSFQNESKRIDLYWALYSGRQGMNLVGSYNRVADPRLWTLDADSLASAVVDGHPTVVRRSVLESGRTSRSVWTWYWVGGEYTADPGRVRFLQAKARFLGNPATVAVITLGADNGRDASDTDRAMQEFLQHASFPGTGALRPMSSGRKFRTTIPANSWSHGEPMNDGMTSDRDQALDC